MKKPIKILLIIMASILIIILIIIMAGMYKFNYKADDLYIENDNGEIVPFDETYRE